MRRISTGRFALLIDPALIEFLLATDMGTGHCPETRRECAALVSRGHSIQPAERKLCLQRTILPQASTANVLLGLQT